MGKYFLVTLLCTLVFPSGYSQNLKEYLDKGDRFLSKKDYDQALSQYMEAYKDNSDDAGVNFRVGLAYLYMPEKSKALPYLEKAYEKNQTIDEDVNYHLGMAFQFNYEFQKAIEQFELFKRKNKKLSDIADHKILQCHVSDSLLRKPLKVVLENLGTTINAPAHDYAPIVSMDGGTLIYTSNRTTSGNINRGPQESFEDIYISKKIETNWSSPQLISSRINIKYNDAAASLSPDGKTLFLYYEHGSGDIYTSTFDGSEWSVPAPLNKNINSPFWETSASLSPDGSRLYFTSSRPGGLGQLDIYYCDRDSKGDWGKAVNLGKAINTAGNEDSPFIHADGVSLFFSSDGHPTMGSNDIFMTVYKDGTWKKPRNLGYPINSLEYDGFFSISADKKTGYYSTIREEGYGDADIYKVMFLENPQVEEIVIEEPVLVAQQEIEEEPQPIVASPEAEAEEYIDPIVQFHKDLQIVTLLKGKVIDANSAEPLEATITLVDNEINSVVARIKSNKETGEFELTIPHGGNYGVATERRGYLFNSINFNLPQFAEYQEIDTHILMMKAEVGSKSVLKNVFFDSGESDLKKESIAELQNIIELLESNPNLNVQINGYTDNTGDVASNKILSLKRANSVVDYLVGKSISLSRLSAVGYGEERPLVSNDDEKEGREINRRTEIEITKVDE